MSSRVEPSNEAPAAAKPSGKVEEIPMETKNEPASHESENQPTSSEPRNKPKNIPFREILFRFATPFDKCLMAVGIICALAAGSAAPLMTVVFGNLTDSLNQRSSLESTVNGQVLYFLYLAAGTMLATYGYIGTFTYTSEMAGNRLRKAYLAAVLRQEVAFFDNEGGGSISTRIVTDTQLLQDGIGEKVPMLVMNVATFVVAFVIAFTKNAELTGVLICAVPIMALLMSFFRKYIVVYTRAGLDFYARAGDVAEEALAAARTVAAFMAHNKLSKRYNKLLVDAEVVGIKKAVLMGVLFGLFQLIIYNLYSLAFFYGGTMLIDGRISQGNIMTVFMSVLIGAFSIAGSSGEIQAIGFAMGAGTLLFRTIDRKPTIDSSSKDGDKLDKVEGKIEVKNVKFKYPSRPTEWAIRQMDLTIYPGKTVALVGSSGSGKSTLIQLVERFYDPLEGTVSLDGVDLRKLNVHWLRQQIGYVTQEPTLFKGTILDNVAHGLVGTEEQVSKKEIEEKVIEACKFANAHEFIMKLPNKYETKIGERGLLLSGGQKQRVAIARAIIKNPKILLLDEATSALDTHSEKVVQQALDRAAAGRTTVVIAHRLSTIRDADLIVVMHKGSVVETGNHQSLLQMENGLYKRMVEAQKIDTKRATGLKEKDPDAIEQQENSLTSDQKKSLENVAVSDGSKDKSQYDLLGALGIMYAVMKLNAPEKWYVVAGVLAAIGCGVIMPIFAVIYGNIIQVFFERDKVKLRNDANFWALMFFVISICGMIFNFFKYTFFGISGEKLTTRLRELSFAHMLRQEIGWFDDDKNSVGALTTSLSSAAQQVQNMSGSTLGTFLEFSVSIVATAIVSLVYGWKLALVVLSTLPLVIWANKLRIDMMRKGNLVTKEFYENSAQSACEAISAIRTVAALTREEDVSRIFSKELEEPLSIGVHHAYYGSILFAFSQSVNFLQNALAFWYGFHLLIYEGYDIQNMFVVIMGVIFSGQSSGRLFSLLPDLSKAQIYARDILKLLERQPKIDSFAPGQELDKVNISGDVQFADVQFNYPTRPGIQVLKGLNLTIKHGQYAALVGSSGCGKSTTVGLLEHFYNASSGKITIDGKEISSLSVGSLRQVVSIVSQEPSLFNMSIRDNITLGKPEGEIATDEEVTAAAKKANIHDFIMGLPQNYQTSVGGKGSQLSGGQKQRIAIARSLLLNPKILLLDEATSALDAESEKVVQEALDAAAKGRTTIAIAHRLSTIKNADVIYVFQDGVVLESGTHSELVERKGLYYTLANQQDLNA